MLWMREHLTRLSWIALVAILGLAVVPTLSRAMAAAQAPSPWVEVCSPSGMRWVSLDGQAADAQALADTGAPQTGGGHLDHCPLCGLGHQPLGLPPAAPAVLPPSPLTQAAPALFFQAPHTLHAWASAQPRAPPCLA